MGPEQCGAGGSLGLFLLADPSPASLQPQFSSFIQEPGRQGRAWLKEEEDWSVQEVKLLVKALSQGSFEFWGSLSPRQLVRPVVFTVTL